jgi:hypothetical protein
MRKDLSKINKFVKQCFDEKYFTPRQCYEYTTEDKTLGTVTYQCMLVEYTSEKLTLRTYGHDIMLPTCSSKQFHVKIEDILDPDKPDMIVKLVPEHDARIPSKIVSILDLSAKEKDFVQSVVWELIEHRESITPYFYLDEDLLSVRFTSLTRTPYELGGGENVKGDTLKSLFLGLNSKSNEEIVNILTHRLFTNVWKEYK